MVVLVLPCAVRCGRVVGMLTLVDPPAQAEPKAGRYDSAARRLAQRNGRERGVWIYVPAVELPDEFVAETPRYRVWGTGRGRVLVQLYRDEGRP